MQFLKTLFWVIIGVALFIFAFANDGRVTVNLWGNLQAEVKTWLLVIGPFLLGFLPTWIFHRLSLWQQRRVSSAAQQRALTNTTFSTAPATAPVTAPTFGPDATRITPDGVMASHAGGASPHPAGASSL